MTGHCRQSQFRLRLDGVRRFVLPATPLGRAIEAVERATWLSPLDPLGYLFTCVLAFGHAIAGQYEEVMKWVDTSLRKLPRFRAAVNLKVIPCTHLGHLEKARQLLGCIGSRPLGSASPQHQ